MNTKIQYIQLSLLFLFLNPRYPKLYFLWLKEYFKILI